MDCWVGSLPCLRLRVTLQRQSIMRRRQAPVAVRFPLPRSLSGLPSPLVTDRSARSAWRSADARSPPASIPVVAWFQQALGIDSILFGFGLPDDRLHAPNEKLDLRCYYNGIKACAALYAGLGEKLK